MLKCAWAAGWAMAAVLCCAVMCRAANSSISIGTGAGSQHGVDNVSSVVDFGPLRSIDDKLNEAEATLHLDVPAGHGSVSGHACSGGASFAGGTAGADTFFSTNTFYQLQSSTLAAGTLVPVSFSYAVSANIRASVANQEDFSGGSSSVEAKVNFSTGTGSILDLDGTATAFSSVGQLQRSGTLDADGDSKKVMVDLPIGSSVGVLMFLRTTEGSNSSGNPAVDCDAQAALLWTLTLPPDATLVNLSNPGEPAPMNGSATPADAALAVPPRPDDVVPEPAAATLLCLAGSSVMGRRRTRERAF